jgi:uncharacterized RDD family membrane protein YckC
MDGMMKCVSDAAKVVLRRYAQFVLDRALLAVAAFSAFVFTFAVALLGAKAGGPKFLVYASPAVLVLVSLGGSWWMEVWVPHTRGAATPAMRWLGLRIVTVHGEVPALRDYVLRWLMAVVDDLFFGLVGAVLIAVTPRHQRAGDLVARTLVVRCTS